MSGWMAGMDVEEHGAILFGLIRREHEEYMAEVRSWAELADAEGRVAAARQYWAYLARLEAMDKPWERYAA